MLLLLLLLLCRSAPSHPHPHRHSHPCNEQEEHTSTSLRFPSLDSAVGTCCTMYFVGGEGKLHLYEYSKYLDATFSLLGVSRAHLLTVGVHSLIEALMIE